MKKGNLILCLFLLFVSGAVAQQKPKYVFLLIGDGMGLNHVNLTEVYLAAQEDRNTVFPLAFSTFPFATFATSFSLSNGVTDSAAGGTALAVGQKTKNGVIAMDSAATRSFKSIAYAAKQAGMKVGITTSVSIDHATPASFYANRANRNMYYEIGLDLIKSNFDFFGGSGFLRPEQTFTKEKAPSLFPQFERGGYQLVYGLDEYKSAKKGEKIILMNKKGEDNVALKYAIDQSETDMKLADITDAAIQSLSTDNENGFFLMVEGGKIDWASHANDAATTVEEVLDFNEAVKHVITFYEKHPDETLIIVTADHETGGVAVGTGGSRLATKVLAQQHVSHTELSSRISALREDGKTPSWEEVKSVLSECLGLYTAIKLTEKDDKVLHDIYEKSFVNHQNQTAKSLYATDDKLASEALKALSRAATVSWASGGHSAAYIPVYAIGAGAELFTQKMDNTDIPKKIATAAGLQLTN
ncbi:alkaline phosphatase [Sphingobacterium sp. JB170]|uniref:alkaline phosphatase n=1 Tax=Sphingobacterium sp. JB170 TaxID=1434842 RepID=UPI00097F0A6A|nr:alkaline phosphatase [Sphingobacterium sp. JB170]SJN17496.1 Alkaline phosphatase [Sphingobacterium sp. JB170]